MADAVRNGNAFPIAARTAWLTLIWLIVAGPEPGTWIVGVPTVAVAAWASLQLAPPLPYRIAWLAIPRFVGYFLSESLRGGGDVAMRTLAPRLRIHPGQLRYTTGLPDGMPMALFAGCVSLLPGTLSIHVDGRNLLLHVLDTESDPAPQLRKLERHIGSMLKLDAEVADG